MIVTLEMAWAWDCPNCGARNYSESHEEHLTPEDVSAMGMDPSEEGGAYLLAPENVLCPECREPFEAKTTMEMEP